jgi:PAS domain S-box-containing protein
MKKVQSSSDHAEVLETLLDAPEVMIWMTDERHLCTYVNPAITKFTGFSAKSMQGVNWLDIVHPEDRERVERFRAQCLSRPRNFRNEYRIVLPNGVLRWAYDVGIARFDGRGKFRGYIGLVTDITEQKDAELALREQQGRLQREILEISEREQRRMGRDLHDGLSQRLLAIALRCNQLESRLSRKRTSEAVQTAKIHDEINRAIRQTREISRSLAPISLGKDGLRSGLRELRDLVRDNFKVRLSLRLPNRGISPDFEAAIHIYRIIQEAITNGIRHGGAKKIEIKFAKGKNQHYRLSIRDNGKGMPLRVRSKGMGLAIMNYRAELLGGNLRLQKAPQGGTVVHLEFPRGFKI